MREKVIMRPDRCKACRRCEVACIAAHHGFDMKEAMKRRSEFGPRVRVIKGENYKTTVRCHECFPAPCVPSHGKPAIASDGAELLHASPQAPEFRTDPSD